MKLISKEAGFTLLELLIAMTIGLVVIFGTGKILINGRINQTIQSQQQDIQRQGQDLSNLLKRYIRNMGSNMCTQYTEASFAIPKALTSAGDNSYRFFTRSAPITADGDLSAYSLVFDSDCQGANAYFSAKQKGWKYVSTARELNVFEDIRLTYSSVDRTLAISNPSDSSLESVNLAENISQFDVYTASSQATSFARDPAGTWQIIDTTHPYNDTPAAVKIVFTIDPPADIAERDKVQAQEFTVVAAVRTQPTD